MERLWNQHGWDFINCLIQALIALLAWVAIINTRKKVSSTTRIKLKMRADFRITFVNNLNTAEIVVYIVNLGMAPVYIEEWGISLWKYGLFYRDSERISGNLSTEDLVELPPGKPVILTALYPSEIIGEKAYSSDKVRLYAKYWLGKIYYEKQKIPYNDIERKYNLVKNSAENAHHELHHIAK